MGIVKQSKVELSSERSVYLDANFFIFALLDKTVLGGSARDIYQKIIDKNLGESRLLYLWTRYCGLSSKVIRGIF